MNEETDKNGQNILLKKFIQVSVSLFLKAKRVPLAHRGAIWLGRAPDCCAGSLGFKPQTGPTLRVLK